MKGKKYKVTTFAEMRAAFEKAKADAEKKKQEMKPEDKQQVEDTAKQYEFEADVKETGQKKNLAGYDTREVIVTITAHEKGKKVDESGGFIMTTDMWLAPKIAALDELIQFQLKYMKAVYGEAFVGDMQQMASTVAMYPTFQPMAAKMQAEDGKLQGTPGSPDDDVRHREERRGDERSEKPESESAAPDDRRRHRRHAREEDDRTQGRGHPAQHRLHVVARDPVGVTDGGCGRRRDAGGLQGKEVAMSNESRATSHVASS